MSAFKEAGGSSGIYKGCDHEGRQWRTYSAWAYLELTSSELGVTTRHLSCRQADSLEPSGPTESQSDTACLARCCVPEHCAALCSQFVVEHKERALKCHSPPSSDELRRKGCRPPRRHQPVVMGRSASHDQGPISRICASSGCVAKARQKQEPAFLRSLPTALRYLAAAPSHSKDHIYPSPSRDSI